MHIQRASHLHAGLSTRSKPARSCRQCVANATQNSDEQGLDPDKAVSSSRAVTPWELMGRVVPAGLLADDAHVQQGLIRSAAARASSLDMDTFTAKLQRLLVIMPFLQDRMVRMKPALLAALADDVDLTAERLIQLRALLPRADMQAILSQRPSLLLEPEFGKIPAGISGLQRHFSEEDAAAMAAAEPLLLLENIDAILLELGRYTGAPPHGVCNLLRRQPALVHAVVRGSAALGSGAEFMRDV